MKKKRFISICETNGWNVTDDGDELMLQQYSPAGEDFVFYVSGDCDPMEVFRYAEDFDPEDHVELWLGAKNNGVSGVPTLFELVDDAIAIQSMLDDLARDLICA